MKFPVLNENDVTEDALSWLEKTKTKLGMIPNVEKVMAVSPQLLASYKFMWSQYETISLSPVEGQVVHMTSNFENECAYCIPWHTMMSEKVGMDAETIKALRDGATLPDPKLNTLRSFTRSLIANRGKVSEAELQAFFEAGYSSAQAFEVILGLSMKLITNFTNSIAGTPLDKEVEALRWQKPVIRERKAS